MNIKKAFLVFALLALPLIAEAQALQPLHNLVSSLSELVRRLVPLLIGVAVLAFMYGLVTYILRRNDDARRVMIWSLVALFVMVSFWGIITLAQSALGINPNVAPPVPQVPVSR